MAKKKYYKPKTKAKNYNISRRKQDFKILSYDDSKVTRKVERKIYNDYIRQKQIHSKNKKVDINHLENIFTNRVNYFAMKNIPLIEKKILYLNIYQNECLDSICKILNLTKIQVLIYQRLGIQHFKNNVKKYKKLFGKGGKDYE